MKHPAIQSLALAALAILARAENHIPFPDALEAASVHQERATDIMSQAIPVGNGDLNALLWDRDGALCLRVTKNDIWDARIDTSGDPPLLKMDVKNRTWSGGINKVPSWHQFPYPQPRCAAVVRIAGASEGEPDLPLHLDLRRAVVTSSRTTVRVLADRNVILIESPHEVSLEEVGAKQLPPAEKGETGGVRWLHMRMPGDTDYNGMEYALAVASSGTRHVVAALTSFDVQGSVVENAVALARRTLERDPVVAHEKIWEEFWSASGVRLGDKFFEQSWYRNLYYMRCFCRPGTAMPICLFAGLAADTTPWHGAPTLNYNFQQVYWPMLSTNHIDLMEPYLRFLKNFAPRGRWLAQETYGVDGLFLPLNIFGPEHLVPPESAKSRNRRQIAYVPWTYTLACTGWGLQPVWQRYQHAPDKHYLEEIYPLIRDGAEFYANILELCRDGEFGPSYNPEHGPFGTFNNPADLAYCRFLLGAALKAADALQRDAALAARWMKQLARVPGYETTPLDGQPIIANWKGADADRVPVHNVATPTVPVFPAGEIHCFSEPDRKTTFERTLKWLKHRDDNAHIMVNVARARFSMPEAYTMTRAHFTKLLAPNGLFTKWPGHGSFLSESWAFSGLTCELLMQSVGGVIRVFPAWPEKLDAEFVNLRAEGGFLVSATRKGGKITGISIMPTVDGTLRVLNPWSGNLLERHAEAGKPIHLSPDTP